MRLRRQGFEATTDTSAGDATRRAAWDGIHATTGPQAVIHASRAAELAPRLETLVA